MKKFAVTISAVFYLSISSGATLSFHYCMVKLVSWGLNSKSQSNCSKCGMKMSSAKKCCKDQSKKLKIDSDQRLSENFLKIQALGAAIAAPVFTDNRYLSGLPVLMELPVSNSPPLGSQVPLFIRICSIRI